MYLENRVYALIARKLGRPSHQLSDEMYLVEDLGADPYDLEELAGELEREFDVLFREIDVESWNTIEDVIASVQEAIARQ